MMTASAFSARQCRESLQQPVASEPAGYDPRVAAQMAAFGRQGRADGRSSTPFRHSLVDWHDSLGRAARRDRACDKKPSSNVQLEGRGDSKRSLLDGASRSKRLLRNNIRPISGGSVIGDSQGRDGDIHLTIIFAIKINCASNA